MRKILSVLLLLLSLKSIAGTFDQIQQLAVRRVPWLANHLLFKKISFSAGMQAFELSSKGDQIVIGASDANAASMGLNWYLQYYCHRSISHMGDNLSPVYPLPVLKKKIHITSAFKYHYALNYCTLNYTMSFYSWKDWEHELDWMALHGVNLMLATIGTEAVWQQTLEKFGFSDKEIKAFIPGPAFNAWWLMGNLEGWGGSVTQRMIDRRRHLEQKILARMKELGIEPVFQGFYGMVPRALKKHFPEAAIRTQGEWTGGFERPDFLLPGDTLFHRMANVYYEKVEKLYGKSIHFFGGDPFHEGGSTKGVDLTQAGNLIQTEMQRVFPNSTWVLQGWEENPRKELLAGLDRSKVLVLELAGEKSNDWERRKGFDGTPFIWCTVNNYGEKSGLYGKLQLFADEVNRINTGQYKNLCKGIGVMPEGIHNNPVVYDLMLDLGWREQKVAVKDWIKEYVQYRYGSNNDTLQQAWKIFFQTVYCSFSEMDGLPENILCARPAWNIQHVSAFGKRKRNYDTAWFATGVRLFLSTYASMSETETWLIDAIDFSRQVLANKGDVIYNQMESAYAQKDSVLFKEKANRFLKLILVDDSLLSLDKNFRLDSWIDAARALGKTPYEKDLFEKNARDQVSFWGSDNPATTLHEYANKDWSGVLKTLYFPRWKMFMEQVYQQLCGQPNELIDYFSFEKDWALKNNISSATIHIGSKKAFLKRAINNY
ncbi:alpha-N-acetylglucosaminidase [Ginsengibacter hankyongi]|uniref:Alpha-N-acetylglucosaminidase n=1 Tax=Ginsengibacter hankyongi TaxID=2607284 RepID=A0A5J5IFM6_9BACT|nr:alpha-N-acetylglucosaminidase [Ginsengibacter hankyongi]KAA9038682.1 alpha-N-acetylglucosaminidase [Ginsengibacter hankyongi]